MSEIISVGRREIALLVTGAGVIDWGVASALSSHSEICHRKFVHKYINLR